ncbi:MAG: beta strand repeat-containing protein [Spirosomataceae bacterium]
MRTKFTFLFLLLSLSFTYAQSIRYVRPVASGSGDGSSWANASSNLQAMINASGVQQVWVAAGTYKPTSGTDRTISFSMKNGVAIYGGFAGTETQLSQRNWVTRQTILSGDIGTIGLTDNTYRIIYNANLNSTAVLDGVTICDSYQPTQFNGNQGGGVWNNSSSPTFRNCIIRNNYSAYHGGGIANNNGSPTFINCIFKENTGRQGGGMWTEVGSPVLTNCTFVSNTAVTLGGALAGNNFYGSTNYIIRNCIFWGNIGSMGEGFIFNNQGATADVTYSNVQGGYSGIGNLNTNPLFTNASGGDFSLQQCSPAINAGDNTGISGVDLANNPRIFNNGVVDMGAFEYHGTAVPSPTAVSISQTTACPGTSVNLQATCTSGTVNWYNTSTGGTALGTGASFSYIAPVGANQTFYASCKTATCETALVATSNTLTVNILPTRLYVNASATAGNNTGLDWANAFTDLQSALNYPCKTNLTEIWVAKGTYKPHASTRSVSFNLINGVTIYGGFPNDGSGTLANRNPKVNETILSGDLLQNDGSGFTNYNDNSYHVVSFNEAGEATLDGFIVERGNSNQISLDYGAGILVYTNNATLNINQCTVRNNLSNFRGAAMYISYLNGAGRAYLNLRNSFILNNSSQRYSAVDGDSNVEVLNTVFANNSSSQFGIISRGNVSQNGSFINCTFFNNSTPAIFGFGGQNVIQNCIATGNLIAFGGASISNSVVSSIPNGSIDGGGNIIAATANAFLLNPANLAGSDNVYGTADDGLSLSMCSPAVNAGNNSFNTTTSDIAGSPRIFNGGTVDIGAYEYQGNPSRLYVNASATAGANNGTSWVNAFTDLQAALSYARANTCVTEIWVAKGTYKPHASTRSVSFNLINGVTIYGGFPNDGSGTLANRNPSANETILSGEIGNLSTVNDNSYHVIYCGNTTTNTAVLNGFAITGSYADIEQNGGGAFLMGNNGVCSPIFANCIFRNNIAGSGGAVAVEGNLNSTSVSPTFTNCLFYNNIVNTNSDFSSGGAINGLSNVTLNINNCTFTNNQSSGWAGAINAVANSGNPTLNINNSILWNNSAARDGNEIYMSASTLNISNSILKGGTSSIGVIGINTIINNAGGVLDANPLFVNTAAGDFSLQICSPAINSGNNLGVSGVDLANNPRIFNNGVVDMGAYELQSSPITSPTAVSISQTTVCQGTSVNLQATCTSGTVNWYNSATGGTALGTGSSFSYIAPVGANQTFYASCKTATCETALVATSNILTVNAKPSVPAITPPSQLVVCSPSNLTLTANCATGTVLWSNNSTGTSLTLNSVGTYSISAKCVFNGCESDASSATNLEIKAKPSVPTVTPPSQLVVCSPTTLTLTATCTTGTVLWSNNSTGTSLTLNSVGTYSISAKCVQNGCESDPSSATNLEIKAKPSVPTITPPSQLVVCSPSNLTLTATCATGTVLWSNNSTGTTLMLNSVGTYSISAKCVLNGCESDPSSTTSLEIKAKPSVPTITPPSQLIVCSPSTLTLTATCATGTVLWSNNSTGTSLTLNSVGTYSISAKCVLNGCESDPSSTTNLEIKAKPSVPTVTPPSQLIVCSPSNLTLTANCTTGTVLWSNNSTGTSLILNSVGTYSISAKCVQNGCESDPSSATNLEIKAKPSVPTITPPSQLVVCSPANLTLTANCTTGTVLWSDNSTGTSLTLNSVGTYSISAKCVLNGCESDPSSATNLEIKAKPSVPTITPPSQLVVCSPSTLTLTATCATGTVLWSNNSTGTSLTLNSVGTYSISAKCVLNGCESDASSATNLEIKAKPTTPTITPPSQLVVCSPSTLTLTATCAGGNVVWSNNSTGTSLTLNSVGTYSISAKCVLNGCDSDASSTTNLEIKAKPSVPTITPPSQLVVCSPASLTLTANCTTGTVLWSNNSTGTSLTLNSVGTYSISAKCVLNGCESDASSVTNLEIKAKPSVPTITPPSQLVVCSPSSLTLTATCASGTVLWSNNSTGTILTLNSVGTYSISAKCTLNGCESDPSSTTNLEIKAKPSVPTITPPSQLVVCSPSSLTLTATCVSGTVLWSNNSTGTSLTLNSVGTYAISAKCVLNGCDSDPSSVTNLEIKAKPSVPTITPPSQLVVCSPASLTLTANCTTGTVLWSNNSTGTSLTLNSVGTYSISAKCVLNGCESDPSSVTNLEIKAKPSVPTITPPSQLVVCSPSNLTLTANCATGNVVWSNNSTGTSLTLNSVGTYSISAKCTLNGCESDPSSITNLEIKALPVVSATNTGPYTVGQTISLTGGGAGTYSWSGPNNFSSTSISPSIPNALTVNGGIYTLTVLAPNGCSASNTTEVIVTGVNPCDPSRIVDYIYVKSGNPHQPLFNLVDGMTINQISEQVSVLVTPSLCPSVTIESFEMNLQGPEFNWNILQNVAPNALFDNSGSDIWGRNFIPGNYTLTVTGYAQDNKGGGVTYGPKIIRFTVVGNLATINAPMLSKTTVCAGSTVDVSFATSGTFSIGNEFRVELSDSSGSFATPVLVGTINTTGTLSCTIPQNTLEGTKYLIRVASSNQVVVSNPAISQVTVHPNTYNLVNPTNNLTGMSTKKAVTSINASNKIISPASVNYQAGKSVILNAGFEANAGSVFEAKIAGCN